MDWTLKCYQHFTQQPCLLQAVVCGCLYVQLHPSARMSKITNDGLTWLLYSCTDMSTLGVKALMSDGTRVGCDYCELSS